jgi:RND family efflux transporter MFP subunit
LETKDADLTTLKIDRSKKEDAPRNKNMIYVIVGIVVIAILSIITPKLWNLAFGKAIEVELTSAVLQSPSQSNAILTASGYVVAQRKAAVASKGTGRLIYLGVVEGDKVFTNQVIARLEDSDIKAQLEQAKATLKLYEADLKDAQNTFKRVSELLKSGASTQAELDAAESRLNRVFASIELAKAQILAAEVAMENTLVRAPFNGTVLTKNADVGEIVAPLAAGINSKAAVVTIADMSSLQVEADVSESNIEKIKMNQDCEIRLDAYSEKAYPGFVAKIVPTANRAKATVMVKIGFRNYDQRVLPEMSAKVVFLNDKISEAQLEEKQLLVVERDAIIEKESQKFVFIIRDDKAVEVKVETGKDIGSYIEIKSGILNGDKVIKNVSKNIVDGVKVKVK